MELRWRSPEPLSIGSFQSSTERLDNNDLLLTRRFASTGSGARIEFRRDQTKGALAGRAAEIKRVRERESQRGILIT